VHFATHGLLASETEMLAPSRAEPALILSPPEQATEDSSKAFVISLTVASELTAQCETSIARSPASEIAQLKLDADWVVLSACNTAAGGSAKPGAEALSGVGSGILLC
jgi:CHAT domain-containing protein